MSVQTRKDTGYFAKQEIITSIEGSIWKLVGVPTELIAGAQRFAAHLGCMRFDMNGESVKNEYFKFREQVPLSHMDEQIIEGGILPHL